ncbi:MAG TPA: peptide ABC transporter substrate-binding protein [Caldilineae bacterium]|nr:peptide ABC transporter substrate-binding protein [Caldilineae bacterium]
MAEKRLLSRRQMLKWMGLSGAGAILAACAPATPTLPTPTPLPKPEAPTRLAPATPTPAPTKEVGEYVNAFGVRLPADAAPPEQQYIRIMARDGESLDFPVTVYSRPDPPWQTLSTPLVQLNKNFELEPGAALSWEVADDGLTWTFHLDPNLKWSDGVPVTAYDYEWTFQYMADPEHGYDFAWYWGFSCNPKNWDKIIKGELPPTELGVKALDDHTLQIVTERPAPYTPATMIFSRPLAKHQVEKYGVYYNNDPKTSVSSEPWILEEWTKGKRIVLGPNLNYTGRRKPYLERFIFIIGDLDTEFDAYLADEVDWARTFSPGDLDFIMSDPELQKQYHPGFGDFRTHYLFFDAYNPPFNDVRVRQAFAHAIDREALVNNIIKILGRPAYGMLMPGYPDAVDPEELKPYQGFDPELARQLLAEAGYPNGEGFPKLTLWLRQEAELGQAIGNAIASMIKEVLGIEVDVSNKEQKIFMEKMNAHEITFGMVSYGMDYFDASNLLGIWKSGGRHAWTNEEFDRLVTEASSLMGDPERRHEMFVKAQHILSEDVGGVFLWHVTPGDMWKPYIKGEQLEPDKWGVAACHWPCMESIGVTSYTVYVSKEVFDYPRGKK